MLDMTSNDLTYLVRHLSHGINVHETYYQTLSDVIERTKIGLLLTLKDAGKLELFKGRKIENISIEGEFEL